MICTPFQRSRSIAAKTLARAYAFDDDLYAKAIVRNE